jgi:hypothetical protein
MWNPEDLAAATPSELGDLAEASMRLLAQSDDPAAFGHLLTLTHESSWSQVADIAGTSRQAAWERWRSH